MESVFSSLAEPHRRAILGLLVERERSVQELERLLKLPQPTISKHLKVLRDAGLVESRVEAQWRVYYLRLQPFVQLDRWLEPYRRRWRESVDALERHLDRMSDPKKGRLR
jgi:DNA-binding transcriptional ArsR family regulator